MKASHYIIVDNLTYNLLNADREPEILSPGKALRRQRGLMKLAKRISSPLLILTDLLKEKAERILPRSRFMRNVAVLAGSSAFGQLINISVAPILSRLYTPGDYGLLAVYASILGLLLVVVSLRYEMAIPLPDDEVAAANLLALSLIIVIVISTLSGFAVWLLGEQVAKWTKTPSIVPYLWLLPIGLLGAGIYQTFSYWAIRGRAFTRLARTRISQSTGMAATQLGLGISHMGPLGLLVGDMVGRIGGSGTLAILTWRNDRETLKRISLSGMRSAGVRYKKFPLLSGSSTLLNSAGVQLPALVLASVYGLQVAGLFALGQRIIGTPFSLIGTSVSQVYVGEAARLATDNPHDLLKLFLTTARRLFFIGLIPITALAVGGPWLFVLIFGKAWLGAGQYIQLLALMIVAQFVVVPLSYTLDVLERLDWHFAWDIGRLVLVAGGLIATTAMGLSSHITIAVYSLTMLIAYIGLFLLSYLAIRNRYEEKDVLESG